jgi:hypothetical protein
MIRTTKWLLLLIALLLSPLFARVAGAQTTYNAASCSESAVQSAYATEQGSKADGDIINIPACSATTWSSAWSISPTNSLTIKGQSNTTGTCAPGGSCTATDSTIITLGGSGTTLTFNTAAGKSLRVTGLTINVSLGGAVYGAINFNGNSTSVRFDHNHITDTTQGDHTLQPDAITGVFDHNFFDSTNQANLFFIQPTINGPDGESNATWTVPENFGTSQFLFVENNFFQNGAFVFDCDFGGRIVFRYNSTGNNTRIQTHGVGSGAQRRGCRAMEVYQNTFTFSSSPNTNSFAFLVDYESGTAMWWGNTITGFTTFLREDVVRTNNATYNQTSTPGGFGYCGNSLGPSSWDGNTNSTGYPCLDQIGRGAGQLLTGSFPSLVNQSKGTIAWPNQALVPVYAWNNTLNTNSYAPNHYWQNFDNVSVENRDYYVQLPNVDQNTAFNGTAGVGQGVAASKPSTCTPSVGWWGTDTQTLYVCQSANTWTASYTPYAYPHPLTLGQSAGNPPAAPTNLAAAVN